MSKMKIVLEASGKSFWMADQLRAMGHIPIVVDPGRAKAIGFSRIKNDKIDARILAELCQADLLSEVNCPDQEIRINRMIFSVRDSLVRARGQLVNTVRSLADSEGIEIPTCATNRFYKAVDAILDEFPQGMIEIIEPLLLSLMELNDQIKHCDKQVLAKTKGDELISLLETCPGVGPIVASGFIYTIRDPKRFKSGRFVGSYLGLVPSLYESGKISKKGRITKRGNRQIRWLLCIAANAFFLSKQNSNLKRWAIKLKERVGAKKAKVALARKLASILWAMWRDNKPYEHRLSLAA